MAPEILNPFTTPAVSGEFTDAPRPGSGLIAEYQAGATRTAIYPGQGTGHGLAYAALGLNGEAGEVAEHVAAAFLSGTFTRGGHTAVVKEVGDVLWYAAQVSTEVGTPLTVITGSESWEQFAAEVVDHLAMDLPTVGSAWWQGLSYQVACMTAAAGKVAEQAKKVLRDDGGMVTQARRNAIAESLFVVLERAGRVARYSGTGIGLCAEANLAKLADRARRGVLQGAGDNR